MDGIATDPRDFNQSRCTTVSPLESQQSHETPSIFFIQTRDDTIDRAMLFGHSAGRMSLACLTTTLMNTRLIRWFHGRHPFAI
jgi:hypothetical protein